VEVAAWTSRFSVPFFFTFLSLQPPITADLIDQLLLKINTALLSRLGLAAAGLTSLLTGFLSFLKQRVLLL